MIQNIQKGTSRCIRNYNLFGAAGMKGGEDSILDAVYVTWESSVLFCQEEISNREMRWSNLYFRRIPGVFVWSIDKSTTWDLQCEA